ncbi:MAG: FkbM family methyltransferase [Paludibacter sp.]|nr:FkbM family methyltransferase [Paludibacter sp.]
MKKPLDVRVANFIIRQISKYVRKRINSIDQEEKNDQIWLSNFSNENLSFEYNLSNNVKINLFKDSILCKYIYFSFEEVEISFIKKFLKRGDIFFDIGANIGLFSLHASPILGANGHIYSFEPTPETFTRLTRNIELNSFSNVTLENKGLSNKNEFLQFHVATNGFDAWNSFAIINELGNSDTIKVEVTTLDNYIDTQNISNINLIKLDVEGWELNVLKGAVSLLSSSNSPVLLVEFTETNAFAAGYYCGELFDYVKSFGYEWYAYDIDDNKLTRQQKKLHYPYENLIAIKDINDVTKRLES